MEDERQRLIDIIKMLPVDKIGAVLEFVNRLLGDYPVVETDDELLMD